MLRSTHWYFKVYFLLNYKQRVEKQVKNFLRSILIYITVSK